MCPTHHKKPPPPPILPAWLDDAGLRPALFRVYYRVVRRDGKKGCFESIPSMATGCHLKESTVRDALKELIEIGLVEMVEERPGFSKVHRIIKDPPQKQKHKESEDESNPY